MFPLASTASPGPPGTPASSSPSAPPGCFWVGAAVGSLASVYLLSGHGISPNLGWRVAFGIGALLGGIVLILPLRVTKSPRWLILRSREQEAAKIISDLEEGIEKNLQQKSPGKGKLPLPFYAIGNLIGGVGARSSSASSSTPTPAQTSPSAGPWAPSSCSSLPPSNTSSVSKPPAKAWSPSRNHSKATNIR